LKEKDTSVVNRVLIAVLENVVHQATDVNVSFLKEINVTYFDRSWEINALVSVEVLAQAQQMN
jgi:hypothetical protein